MKLVINCEIPFREEFVITFNGKNQDVNEDTKNIDFDVVEPGEYYLEFKHKPTKRVNMLAELIIFIFTGVLQGIFNILLWNTDSKWYEKIMPFCLNSKIKVEVFEGKTISLKYKYFKGMLPKIYIDNMEISDVKYIPNIYDFSKKYLGYLKRVISILMVSLIVLNVIFFCYVKAKGYTVQSLIIICIEAFLVFITVIILVKENMRLKRLKKDFNQKLNLE